MGKLLYKMGQQVHPRFAKKIREISAQAGANLASGKISNATGAG